MDSTTTADKILERLKVGIKAKSDTELARMLGVSQQSISSARSKDKVPMSWGLTAAERFGLSTDWIFFGTEPMQRPPISKADHAAALAKLEEVFGAMGMTLDPDLLRGMGINVDGQEPTTRRATVPVIGVAGCSPLGVPLDSMGQSFAPQKMPENPDLMAEILRLNQDNRELNQELREARAKIEVLTLENHKLKGLQR